MKSPLSLMETEQMLPGGSESSRQTAKLYVNWAASSEPGEVDEALGALVGRGIRKLASDSSLPGQCCGSSLQNLGNLDCPGPWEGYWSLPL